jgi:hypothetical protein
MLFKAQPPLTPLFTLPARTLQTAVAPASPMDPALLAMRWGQVKIPHSLTVDFISEHPLASVSLVALEISTIFQILVCNAPVLVLDAPDQEPFAPAASILLIFTTIPVSLFVLMDSFKILETSARHVCPTVLAAQAPIITALPVTMELIYPLG